MLLFRYFVYSSVVIKVIYSSCHGITVTVRAPWWYLV